MFRRELILKTRWSKTSGVKGWDELMSVTRKRFRIEQAIMGDMPGPVAAEGGDIGPMHREIMAELRFIRAQMSTGTVRSPAADGTQESVMREVAATQALLETYR